jgi:UDP-glucose 6-dehydrogenase
MEIAAVLNVYDTFMIPDMIIISYIFLRQNIRQYYNPSYEIRCRITMYDVKSEMFLDYPNYIVKTAKNTFLVEKVSLLVKITSLRKGSGSSTKRIRKFHL